jgi:hypothetical protein
VGINPHVAAAIFVQSDVDESGVLDFNDFVQVFFQRDWTDGTRGIVEGPPLVDMRPAPRSAKADVVLKELRRKILIAVEGGVDLGARAFLKLRRKASAEHRSWIDFNEFKIALPKFGIDVGKRRKGGYAITKALAKVRLKHRMYLFILFCRMTEYLTNLIQFLIEYRNASMHLMRITMVSSGSTSFKSNSLDDQVIYGGGITPVVACWAREERRRAMIQLLLGWTPHRKDKSQ